LAELNLEQHSFHNYFTQSHVFVHHGLVEIEGLARYTPAIEEIV
jgi:hypothetical protein